ncbi:hypothetical protein F2Q70_00040525 [Brassica cretica]|uniref:Uncharacterized protein n=1 Tax=Brassica cretica TaxID=69181 RepID=A0A8S9KD07_BRACR|nr:hypothetical protein F2Q70_00040525 [Brassica cretica]
MERCLHYRATNSGLYTVKFGYAIAVEQRRTRQPVEMKEPSTNALKTEVWKLKTPKKMKHFLCRMRNHQPYIIFERPPAVQYWTLSTISSSLVIFPSSSIYDNLGTLSSGGLETRAPIPAMHQSSHAWKMAQLMDSTMNSGEHEEVRNPTTEPHVPTHRWKCQVDASWSESDNGAGLGFILLDGIQMSSPG